MTEEITNPLYGVLNLNMTQFKHHAKRVADMRANNVHHETIDMALSEMNSFQNRVVELCEESGLSAHLILEHGIDPYVPRQGNGGNGSARRTD